MYELCLEPFRAAAEASFVAFGLSTEPNRIRAVVEALHARAGDVVRLVDEVQRMRDLTARLVRVLDVCAWLNELTPSEIEAVRARAQAWFDAHSEWRLDRVFHRPVGTVFWYVSADGLNALVPENSGFSDIKARLTDVLSAVPETRPEILGFGVSAAEVSDSLSVVSAATIDLHAIEHNAEEYRRLYVHPDAGPDCGCEDCQMLRDVAALVARVRCLETRVEQLDAVRAFAELPRLQAERDQALADVATYQRALDCVPMDITGLRRRADAECAERRTAQAGVKTNA